MTATTPQRMLRLSDAQVNALGHLNDGTISHFAALFYIGRSYRRTLGRLEDVGLARYMPYACDGDGGWRLTPDGRALVRVMLADGRLVLETDDEPKKEDR